jgi:hypothetical protein
MKPRFTKCQGGGGLQIELLYNCHSMFYAVEITEGRTSANTLPQCVDESLKETV